MAVITSNDLILQAARGRRTERTPIWLMRQAGRFDPAYRALKEKCGLPLEEMFQSPELAAEITFLPERLGVDALILFQDILTPTAPMGAPFIFRPGPVLNKPIRTRRDLQRLRDFEPADELPFVAESIRLVQRDLAGRLPLLGFAGSPLTVAAFLIEGSSPGGRLTHTRVLMDRDPDLLHALLDRLAAMTASYLRMQIDAGVNAVQLFESIGDLLTESEYRTFAHPYHATVFQRLRGSVPLILFVKEQPLTELMIESGADVLSVGTCVDLAAARQQHGDRVALQGNVDNRLLADGSPAEIEAAVEACIRAGGHRGHILNLNHGLLKETPFDNVCRLIDTCKAVRIDDQISSGQGA